jgi:ribosomal protein S27AE
MGPMICPRCGVAMNHHAEKVVYPSDATAAEPALGGVVEELHACPECGASASRVADAP